MMFWLALLLLYGTICSAVSQSCIVDVLRCARHRVPVRTYKNLAETPEALNDICSQQDRFFRCLEEVSFMYETDTVGKLPENLQNTKLILKELCTESSEWRKSYLRVAPCINKQKMGFCTSPQFLGNILSDDEWPPTECSFREKAINCIAATLSMKCDIEASNMFYYLLKIANDGDLICAYADFEFRVGKEFLKQNFNKTIALINIYSEVDRIGDRLLQSEVEVSDQKAIEKDFPSEEKFVKTFIDNDSSKGIDAAGSFSYDDLKKTIENQISKAPLDDLKVHKGVVIRHHPNGPLSLYWREKEATPSENLTCFWENDCSPKGVFKCIVPERKQSPVCPKIPVDPDINLDYIDPELVDPDLGAEFIEPLGYTEIPQVEESLTEDSLEKSWMSQFTAPDAEPIPNLAEQDEEYLETQTETATELPLSEFDSHRIGYVAELEEAEPGASEKVAFVTLDDSESKTSEKPLRSDFDPRLAEEEKQFHTKHGLYLQMLHFPDGMMVMNWRDEKFTPIKNITCARVNECHPAARRVFKCTITPKKEDETCPLSAYHEPVEHEETIEEAEAETTQGIDIEFFKEIGEYSILRQLGITDFPEGEQEKASHTVSYDETSHQVTFIPVTTGGTTSEAEYLQIVDKDNEGNMEQVDAEVQSSVDDANSVTESNATDLDTQSYLSSSQLSESDSTDSKQLVEILEGILESEVDTA